MFVLVRHLTSTHPRLHSPPLGVFMGSSKFLLRQDYLWVQQGTLPQMKPGRIVQVFQTLEKGHQLTQLPIVYHLVVAGGVVLFLPGQLTNVPALVIYMVVIPAE